MTAKIYIWAKAPALRWFIALACGIVLQWHFQFDIKTLSVALAVALLFVVLYSFSSLSFLFRFAAANGVAVNLLLALAGASLVWLNDVRNDKHWIGYSYEKGNAVVVTIQEPLVEKENSYKAAASFTTVHRNDSAAKANGKLLIYFKKDTGHSSIGYGSQLVFTKELQEIKNSGNPGGFDYKQYCLFQGITHQVYLTRADYVVLPTLQKNWFRDFIFSTRQWVVHTIRKYISGNKEQGLAEALLIGYKDDLDKNLVQAYSNTGVVHVIAISGLHLGIIYWLLLQLTRPIKSRKKLYWAKFIVILAGLWLFSILAGAGPSIIRSAVMFSFLAVGEMFARKTSIYNTIALSAFCLLCYNPFWLWDVGFQLSYAAVLSIVIFFKPIYNWLYIQNVVADFFWKIVAATAAAQILTLPISIYHFHQMPLLFLITNFIAVPLSSAILFGEILLCVLAFIPPAATILGVILKWLVYVMNTYIEWVNDLPFAVWNGLSISLLQTIVLTISIAAICYWLMEKNRSAVLVGLVALILFAGLRTVSFVEAADQKKLIVYNVPKHQAIDIISGRNLIFIGDSDLLQNNFQRNFHLQPSRILHRLSSSHLGVSDEKQFEFSGKKILITDTTLRLGMKDKQEKIDLVVLSKNPRLHISDLANNFRIYQVVADGSVPQWKSKLWKHDCDSLHILFYDVSEKGAFVMNLQ